MPREFPEHPTDPSGWPAGDITPRGMANGVYDAAVVAFPSQHQPILLIVIDCEEEFDWTNPIRGAAYTLESIKRIGPVQNLFKERGMRPTYVVGYPIVADDRSWAPLAQLQADGECQIGRTCIPGSHRHSLKHQPLRIHFKEISTPTSNLRRWRF